MRKAKLNEKKGFTPLENAPRLAAWRVSPIRVRGLMLRASSLTGFTLVEVLIAVSIIVIFIAALISTHTLYLSATFSGLNKVKAIFLAEEGVEAVKLLRDQKWTSSIAVLATGPTNYHYLSYDSSKSFWATSTVNTYIDSIFERRYILEDVYRDDTTKDIVTSGGTLDPNARKLTMFVAWSEKGATTTKSIVTYITNIMGN